MNRLRRSIKRQRNSYKAHIPHTSYRLRRHTSSRYYIRDKAPPQHKPSIFRYIPRKYRHTVSIRHRSSIYTLRKQDKYHRLSNTPRFPSNRDIYRNRHISIRHTRSTFLHIRSRRYPWSHSIRDTYHHIHSTRQDSFRNRHIARCPPHKHRSSHSDAPRSNHRRHPHRNGLRYRTSNRRNASLRSNYILRRPRMRRMR